MKEGVAHALHFAEKNCVTCGVFVPAKVNPNGTFWQATTCPDCHAGWKGDRERLTKADLVQLEREFWGGASERRERADNVDFARRCHWRLRSGVAILDRTRPPETTFDMECIQFISMLDDLGRVYRAGVRWTPEGRVVVWPRREVAGMSMAEVRDVLRRVRLYLPDIVRETRMDNAALALAEIGLSLPEGVE